jgi:hypothetical protein
MFSILVPVLFATRDGDLPSIVYKHGNQEWWRDGERHREYLPDVVRASGREELRIDDERYIIT